MLDATVMDQKIFVYNAARDNNLIALKVSLVFLLFIFLFHVEYQTLKHPAPFCMSSKMCNGRRNRNLVMLMFGACVPCVHVDCLRWKLLQDFIAQWISARD